MVKTILCWLIFMLLEQKRWYTAFIDNRNINFYNVRLPFAVKILYIPKRVYRFKACIKTNRALKCS